MAQLRWTRESERWLRDIYDYIAECNPEAAGRVVDGIFQKAQLLREFPQVGYCYRVEPVGEIRVLLYGHYRIAYLLRQDSELIDVLGVFHGAMDIDRYLK